MTIDEAIRILTADKSDEVATDMEDIDGALQLGIEALNYIIRLRSCSIEHRQHRLPGEDPLFDTSRSTHHIKEVLESPLGREPKG